jgi:hypothetical protein
LTVFDAGGVITDAAAVGGFARLIQTVAPPVAMQTHLRATVIHNPEHKPSVAIGPGDSHERD